MALTDDERSILNQALAEGVFNGQDFNTSTGRTTGRPLTAEVFKVVRQKPDDEVRTILAAYKANKLLQFQNVIAGHSEKITEVTAQRDMLAAMQIQSE